MTSIDTRSIQLRAQVRADLQSVVRWWTDAARRTDLRAQFAGFRVVTDLSWKDTEDDGALVSHGSWTTPRGGMRTQLTVSGPSAHPNVGGASYAYEETFIQVRTRPNARVDRTESTRRQEFVEVAPGLTMISSNITRRLIGFRWWDKAVLRVIERRIREKHFKEWVRNCQREVAASTGLSD